MAKQFKQLRIDPYTVVDAPDGSVWSNNLLETDRIVLGIAIYALPGTRFQFNQINTKIPRDFVMNTFGSFQMDTSNWPITGLFINMEDCERVKTMYPIIIDLIYDEGGGK